MNGFLEQHRLDDEILNKAYYSAKPEFRTLLKNAVSLSYYHFGHNNAISHIKKEFQDLNISQEQDSTPVKNSIIFFDSGYNACGRLCSAALMPILAGAMPPLAICLEGEPHYDLMLALEIAGVEDIFCMTTKKAAELLSVFCNKNAPADVIPVFLKGKFAPTLVNQARNLKLKFYEEKYLPETACILPHNCPEKLKNVHDSHKMLANIEYAQGVKPQMFIYNEEKPAFKDKYYDCIYVPDNKVPLDNFNNCRLLLGPGCEAFWVFPDLSPDFFCQHRFALGFINNEFQRLS